MLLRFGERSAKHRGGNTVHTVRGIVVRQPRKGDVISIYLMILATGVGRGTARTKYAAAVLSIAVHYSPSVRFTIRPGSGGRSLGIRSTSDGMGGRPGDPHLARAASLRRRALPAGWPTSSRIRPTSALSDRLAGNTTGPCRAAAGSLRVY